MRAGCHSDFVAELSRKLPPVTDSLDVAVVGAGPFGLSIAAHLSDRRVRVFGEPMFVWTNLMPRDMLMRSAWKETSLSAPAGQGTIDAWTEATGESREEPIPLVKFLRYAQWFQTQFVAESDPARVTELAPGPTGYRLRTSSGDSFDARHVVIAVGVTPFSYAPPPFADALGDGVRFAADELEYESFRGRRVIVVGGGQSGLETAGLAARAGADVELVVRSPVRWFTDREPHHERGAIRARLYKLAYPVLGYGPPPINRIVMHPDLFAALPIQVRRRLNRRLLRSGGSPWLRGLVEGKVAVSQGRVVRGLQRREGTLVLSLDDGTEREADDVLLATGYRFSLDALAFISPELRARIRVERGWPVVDRYFRSTDPGILFVGYAAEQQFGPISRFVLGADFTATRVASCLRS